MANAHIEKQTYNRRRRLQYSELTDSVSSKNLEEGGGSDSPKASKGGRK